MTTFPTSAELSQYRQALTADADALSAIDAIEQAQDFETAIDQLFRAQAGAPQTFGGSPGDAPKLPKNSDRPSIGSAAFGPHRDHILADPARGLVGETHPVPLVPPRLLAGILNLHQIPHDPSVADCAIQTSPGADIDAIAQIAR
jgi:hypothetical protein